MQSLQSQGNSFCANDLHYCIILQSLLDRLLSICVTPFHSARRPTPTPPPLRVVGLITLRAGIWNLYSIVCMEYPRHIPVIYREMIYLRYIPGIDLHDKSYLSIGFSACIACLSCALWYTQVCKDWRSSMLKIQSLNHFCGICLEYIIFVPVYHVHICNSGLVLVNSQNNLEVDSLHQAMHVTDLSETYDTNTHEATFNDQGGVV